MKLNHLVQIAAVAGAFALGGCGGSTVVVTPASAPIQDNFFVTWEIQSATVGPVTCEEAATPTVDMDIVNIDTGSRQIFTFPCNAYQGTSGPIDVGHFDVLLNLTDRGGAAISQTDVGTENISQAGTIDLGHHVFQIQ